MDRIDFLLEELIIVNSIDIEIPKTYREKRYLLRSLMNVTSPCELSQKYYRFEKELLQEELKDKKITTSEEITEKITDKIYLWKGDIITLEVDAIVNAANSKLLGCFIPHHRCIDNAIHSASGLQLRNECEKIMSHQGHDEKTGLAKLTKGYNLPAKYVIHTVGPIIDGTLTKEDETLLKRCYESCLEVVKNNNDIRTIAFCSISTGEFRFPKVRASEIALKTIDDYLKNNEDILDKVIINVFTQEDYDVYRNTAKKYR